MTLVILDTLEPWQGEPLFDANVGENIRHPRNIETLWSDADLAAIGLRRPVPMAVPDGKVVNGAPSYVLDGNVVREVLPLANRTVSAADVDAERDRRIDSGFTFAGKRFQSRQQDRENISGAAVAALMAISGGVSPSAEDWQGPGTAFAWIAEDNSLVPMTAGQVLQFGQTAMGHKQAHIFAARAIKDQTPIPLNYTSDAIWNAALGIT